MSNVLTNREYQIDGNWNEPAKFLRENFKSVIGTEMIDITSSAGDWSGLVFQKIGGKIKIIPFEQTNNYPSGGFTLYTSNHIFASIDEKDFNQENKEILMEEFFVLYYS
ncbi:MAG: hypothetical protein ACLFUH_11375 [Bacteroidales bacterium]